MCECGCGTCDTTDSEIKESADPYIEEYKHLLKKLGQSISSVHKTEEGKKLSGDYWRGVVKLLKKVKLGVAMMELGIDDEDEIHDTHDSEIDKVKPTPAGEKGEGGPRDGASKPEEKPTDDSKSKEQDKEDEDEDEDEEEETNESITEKSVSKSQQRLFGMVHAYNKGELKKSDIDADLYSKIKKLANDIGDDDAKKMAKTKHNDLPEKVPSESLGEDTLNHFRILLQENDCNFTYTLTENNTYKFEITKNDVRLNEILYSDNFYLVKNNKGELLGNTNDLYEVVNTFFRIRNS